jgi:hypothetical protein
MAGLAVLPLAVLAWILTAPLRTELHPALYSALVAGVAIAFHRALMFAESRGWIYYRKRSGSYGGLGVTSEWLNIYDPSRKHLQAATRVQEWKREEDDDGDGKGTVPPGATRTVVREARPPLRSPL